MRQAGELNLGYYPTSKKVLEMCYRSLDIDYTSQNRPIALDPCCGNGEIGDEFYYTDNLGIELDMGRAMGAEKSMTKVLNSDAFKVNVQDDMASVLFLNPPYNQVKGGKRLEYMFLRKFMPSLQTGGILIFIIQRRYLQQGHIAKTLASHYSDLSVKGYPDTDFDQIIIFGVKRKSPIQPDSEVVNQLQKDAKNKNLPMLEYGLSYQVPPRLDILRDDEEGNATYTFKALGFDFARALKETENTSATEALKKFLFVKKMDKNAKNPPMPFKSGHAALLAVSGFLDGVIGEGESRHIVKARAIKKKSEKVIEEDEQIIRIRRDRFQIEAKVLLPDGTIKVLTSKEDQEQEEKKQEQSA